MERNDKEIKQRLEESVGKVVPVHIGLLDHEHGNVDMFYAGEIKSPEYSAHYFVKSMEEDVNGKMFPRGLKLSLAEINLCGEGFSHNPGSTTYLNAKMICLDEAKKEVVKRWTEFKGSKLKK